MKILVLNAGSSSHKAALFDLTDTDIAQAEPLWRAQLDWTARSGAVALTVKTAEGGHYQDEQETTDHLKGIQWMLQTLWEGPVRVLPGPQAISAVGHRVVHGGREYQHSVRVDESVKDTIRRLFPLAPAHNPANLEGIEVMETLLGEVPQVAVFDTAFHTEIPDRAALYPGPYDWVERGIRRYGFHGISHQYVAQRAATLLQQPLYSLRLITCHLGNGCSLSAVEHGHSIDTTMGFTPLEGLMMGSRSGSVDPGILIHLLRQGELTVDELDHQLNRESGLKGISGVSNDLRQIRAAIAADNARAHLAVEMFVHRLRREIGGLLATLQGLDALVFTAGIGENSPFIWERACQAFEFMGLRLDPEQLTRDDRDRDITAPDSSVRVLVIHTQEEWAIACECLQVLSA